MTDAQDWPLYEIFIRARGGLDHQPGAVRLQRLPHVPGRRQRVTHVVQAVERRGQVIAGAAE